MSQNSSYKAQRPGHQSPRNSKGPVPISSQFNKNSIHRQQIQRQSQKGSIQGNNEGNNDSSFGQSDQKRKSSQNYSKDQEEEIMEENSQVQTGFKNQGLNYGQQLNRVNDNGQSHQKQAVDQGLIVPNTDSKSIKAPVKDSHYITKPGQVLTVQLHNNQLYNSIQVDPSQTNPRAYKDVTKELFTTFKNKEIQKETSHPQENQQRPKQKLPKMFFRSREKKGFFNWADFSKPLFKDIGKTDDEYAKLLDRSSEDGDIEDPLLKETVQINVQKINKPQESSEVEEDQSDSKQASEQSMQDQKEVQKGVGFIFGAALGTMNQRRVQKQRAGTVILRELPKDVLSNFINTMGTCKNQRNSVVLNNPGSIEECMDERDHNDFKTDYNDDGNDGNKSSYLRKGTGEAKSINLKSESERESPDVRRKSKEQNQKNKSIYQSQIQPSQNDNLTAQRTFNTQNSLKSNYSKGIQMQASQHQKTYSRSKSNRKVIFSSNQSKSTPKNLQKQIDIPRNKIRRFNARGSTVLRFNDQQNSMIRQQREMETQETYVCLVDQDRGNQQDKRQSNYQNNQRGSNFQSDQSNLQTDSNLSQVQGNNQYNSSQIPYVQLMTDNEAYRELVLENLILKHSGNLYEQKAKNSSNWDNLRSEFHIRRKSCEWVACGMPSAKEKKFSDITTVREKQYMIWVRENVGQKEVETGIIKQIPWYLKRFGKKRKYKKIIEKLQKSNANIKRTLSFNKKKNNLKDLKNKSEFTPVRNRYFKQLTKHDVDYIRSVVSKQVKIDSLGHFADSQSGHQRSSRSKGVNDMDFGEDDEIDELDGESFGDDEDINEAKINKKKSMVVMPGSGKELCNGNSDPALALKTKIQRNRLRDTQARIQSVSWKIGRLRCVLDTMKPLNQRIINSIEDSEIGKLTAPGLGLGCQQKSRVPSGAQQTSKDQDSQQMKVIQPRKSQNQIIFKNSCSSKRQSKADLTNILNDKAQSHLFRQKTEFSMQDPEEQDKQTAKFSQQKEHGQDLERNSSLTLTKNRSKQESQNIQIKDLSIKNIKEKNRQSTQEKQPSNKSQITPKRQMNHQTSIKSGLKNSQLVSKRHNSKLSLNKGSPVSRLKSLQKKPYNALINVKSPRVQDNASPRKIEQKNQMDYFNLNSVSSYNKDLLKSLGASGQKGKEGQSKSKDLKELKTCKGKTLKKSAYEQHSDKLRKDQKQQNQNQNQNKKSKQDKKSKESIKIHKQSHEQQEQHHQNQERHQDVKTEGPIDNTVSGEYQGSYNQLQFSERRGLSQRGAQKDHKLKDNMLRTFNTHSKQQGTEQSQQFYDTQNDQFFSQTNKIDYDGYLRRRNSMMTIKNNNHRQQKQQGSVSQRQAANLIIMSQNMNFRLAKKKSNPYCSSTQRSSRSPFF